MIIRILTRPPLGKTPSNKAEGQVRVYKPLNMANQKLMFLIVYVPFRKGRREGQGVRTLDLVKQKQMFL